MSVVRPPARSLSPIARVGREMFFDARLSGSGAVSCATCHDPARAYGPPPQLKLPGFDEAAQGDPVRAIPSLRYSDRTPPFAIGPDREDASGPVAATMPASVPPRKIAEMPTSTPLVPRGGLFWDGRADSFEEQAVSPLMNPVEMANANAAAVSDKLRHFGYAARLATVTAVPLTTAPGQPSVLDEALFAVARFEAEDPSFHPYSSRYDRWLEGRETLTAAELRGLRVFEDPSKGNCAACHLD
ncbi:MAG: cytochrome-c peroxidase, partial [Vicinamibacterales bacterium]